MAKPTKAGSKPEKYPYPSHYGSHRSMVVDREGNEELYGGLQPNQVVCLDEFGQYMTTVDRLDTGVHDSRRTAASRMHGEYYKSICNQKEDR